MSAAVVAHSGGPTPVINASLLGVVEEAQSHPEIRSLWGARFGIAGMLREDFIDLFRQPEASLSAVARTPSSALGSSRHEVTHDDMDRVLSIFRAHDVRYFFYTGGNGSMGTAHQIERLARAANFDIQVIGIPKTIDNDIVATDHTPGYASTARFFAEATREIDADNRALPGQVEIIEVLGRNAGWIVAATSLARVLPDDGPHLIYCPERPLPLAQLLEDVQAVYRRLGRCVLTVCEGQLDENGEPFGADVRSGSRSSLAMNLGHRLALLLTERLRIRARSEKPGLLGRATAHVSQIDWEESRLCGQAAVRAAANGISGKMITLERTLGATYSVKTGLIDLEQVAFVERLFPDQWRSSAGNDILPEFRSYASALVGDIRPHPRLEILPITGR